MPQLRRKSVHQIPESLIRFRVSKSGSEICQGSGVELRESEFGAFWSPHIAFLCLLMKAARATLATEQTLWQENARRRRGVTHDDPRSGAVCVRGMGRVQR